MRSLKQYWQQLFARNRNSPQPQHAPRTVEFERKIALISNENQTLSAELSQVRTDFEAAHSEENRKIAALEQVRQEFESAHRQDRERLLVLEGLGTELEQARSAEAQRLARLEDRLAELETGHDEAREQVTSLQASLATAATRLEATTKQVSDLQDLVINQVKTFQTSLSQTADRLDDTEEYVRSMEKKLENDHRHYANTLQELQLDQRRQNQRVSWAITVAGLALLLGTVAGGLLIWDVQKNAGVLTAMSSDMKTLMSSINQHQSLRHGQAGPQPLPALAPAPKPPVQPARAPQEAAPPQQAATPDTRTPAAGAQYPLNAFDRLREEKRQGTPGTTRQEADAFFEENAAAAGIVELPSGLQYRVVKPGSGKTPTLADQVVVDYLGATPDGTVFDNTYSAGEPATYRMREVIPGWQEALLNMREGAEWELYLSPQLAQKGSVRNRSITGYEPSIYLIELLQVIEGNQAEAE